MKKSVFTNAVFYWSMTSILTGLLLWNLYLTIAHFRLGGLLPIVIQSALLVLIFRKHEYARVGIIIWAIVFLVAGSGMQFMGRFIKDLAVSFKNADLQNYFTLGIPILIGIMIVSYTNKTVKIVETVKEEPEPNHV